MCGVFKTSRTYLKKDVRNVVTSQKHLSQVFLVFKKYITKMTSSDFRSVITISDKIDVGPPETFKKWNVLRDQCRYQYQSIRSVQWADIYVEALASQGSSKPISKCIIYFFQWFFSTDKTIYNLLSLWTVLTSCWNTEILAKLQKKLRN